MLSKKGGWSGDADVIIFYLGQARLSCSGNINSVQTKTIPTIIPMTIMLDLIFDLDQKICYDDGNYLEQIKPKVGDVVISTKGDCLIFLTTWK